MCSSKDKEKYSKNKKNVSEHVTMYRVISLPLALV